MTNDEMKTQLAELLSELEEVSSELSDIDLDVASELKTALDTAEQAKTNAEQAVGEAEQAVSELEDVISNLEAISLPDPSDLTEATDRIAKAVKSIQELAEHLDTIPKSLTLVIKQGSAEQKFYLHPDTPAQIEIITE
jgi:methyl-accepting chemotaxis protein